jgi:hypothetical protein
MCSLRGSPLDPVVPRPFWHAYGMRIGWTGRDLDGLVGRIEYPIEPSGDAQTDEGHVVG